MTSILKVPSSIRPENLKSQSPRSQLGRWSPKLPRVEEKKTERRRKRSNTVDLSDIDFNEMVSRQLCCCKDFKYGRFNMLKQNC